jgi:hypothetical protein
MSLWQDFTVTYLDTVFRKFHIAAEPPLPGDELYTILRMLLDEQQIQMWQLTRLYDQLDSIMASSPEQRARISPQLSDILAQRGVIADVKNMIEGHRPRVKIETDEMSIRFKRNFGSLWHDLTATGGTVLDLESVAFPASRFRYPKGPKVCTQYVFVHTHSHSYMEQTEQWARECEAVDEAMTHFWVRADQQLRGRTGKALFSLVKEVVRPHVGSRQQWGALGK